MVEIDLGQTSGSYNNGDANITIIQENYNECDFFKKVTYTIGYQSVFSASWYNYTYRSNSYNLYIKNKNGKVIFTYYCKESYHIVTNVESYNAKNNLEIPLILGFKRRDKTYYYTFKYLKTQTSHTGSPAQDINSEQLTSKLTQEYLERNKITFNIDTTSRNYHEDIDNKTYGNVIQYKYSVDQDDYVGPYSISAATLFSHDKFKFTEFSFLNSVDTKKYDFINIYYTKNNIAFLAEFVQHSVSDNKTTYNYFKRKIKDGTVWVDISDEVTNSSVDNLKALLKNLYYSINDSIVILANKNEIGDEYPINLVENTFSGIISSDSQPDPTNKITVKNDKESLSDYKYKSYEHSLIQTTEPEPAPTTLDFLSNVSGLRIFIGSGTTTSVDLARSVEIKLYSHDGNERKYLYYDSSSTGQSSPDKKNKIYCYFYDNDNVPLMIYGGGFFYRPKSLNEYFDKWVQIPGINFTQKSSVDSKLKDINKELNLINLSLTSIYGLPDPETGQLPQDFRKDRITVTTETPSSLFKMAKHATTNTGPIGNICHGGSELKAVSEPTTSIEKTLLQTIEGSSGSITTVTTTSYTTVCAYYHLSDSAHKKPLLIGITKVSNKTPDLFFERNDNTSNSKWKKIESHESGKFSDNTKLAEKINKLHYNFNYSIKIKLENQGSDRINNYNLELVKNIGSDTLKLSDSDNKITSNKYNCLTGSSYTCYRHTITLGKTNSSDVGGLRFYIGNQEIQFFNSLTTLGKLFIYFNHNYFQVHVYFYTDGSTTDKVPLLVRYDGKYYGPKSKDDYFNQWVLVDGLDSSSQSEQITPKLTEINRSLNEVNISETTDGSSYGLKKPHPPNGIDDDFCNRINVKQEDKTNFYNKLVHNTINKGPIGNVMYNKTNITTDFASPSNDHNQVCVYYHTSDTGYNRPLLICIRSQNHVTSCVKWYYRQNVEGTQWKDDTISQKYGSDQHIRDQLQSIQSRDSNFLNVQLENQESQYPGCVVKGGEKGQKKEIGEITVDRLFVVNTYKVDNYRCFHHKLNDYYIDNKDTFNTQLSLGIDPTLELAMNISNCKIHLNDTQGKLTSLYYTNELAQKQVSVYVYFYEPKGFGDYDKVPLLFIFGQLFFVPTSKQDYLKQWKQVELKFFTVIGDVDPKKNLVAKLSKITRLLNEINLEQTGTDSSYGEIKPTQGTDTLKASPRVNVKRVIDTSYNSVTHSTEKTGCIGNVTFNTQNLMVVEGDQPSSGKTMLEVMEQELEKSPTIIYNSLNSYYHHSDKSCKTPLLIKISGDGSGTRIEALYYERLNSTDQHKWKKVDDKSSLEKHDETGITNKVNQIFYNFTSSVKIELATATTPGRTYLAKLIKNGEISVINDLGPGVSVKVEKKTKCNVPSGFTCIEHTVNMNSDFSSQVGGLRFYFGKKELETFKDSSAQNKMPIYYNDSNKDVHVYFHNTNSTVPLMFKYNSQCFRPLNKTNYFTKWVYDSQIRGTGHPQLSKLDSISQMLNEINLAKTGNDSSGKEYGLTVPKDAGDLNKFDGKRITVKHDSRGSGKGYKSVTHTTIDNLGIGPVKYNGEDVTDNSTSSKNLSEVVKQDPSLTRTVVNQVTVYYHETDTEYTTPLMLGFGSTNGGVVGVDTGATTPLVFYERVDSNTPPLKWVKVQGPGLEQPGSENNIAQKLQEIRYRIGKSVVITLTKQVNSGGESPVEYPVQVVENKSGVSRPTGAGGGVTKIQVTKSENCTGTSAEQGTPTPPKNYACYDHKIPPLTSATESQYIGGVKFYVCANNHTYLPTFGPSGHPEEPIYYNATQSEVKVYFYSNGHGPPSSDGGSEQPDTVPLLVKYGLKYYRPSSRFNYFTSWVATEVQGEGQGNTGTGKPIKDVLDTINKELNTVDLLQTGTGTTGAASGYGLGKTPGTNCPCSDPKDFCNRVNVERKKVTKPASQAGGGEARASLDTSQTTLFHKVTHATTNGAGIGPVCYAGQVIQAIKPNPEEDTNSVCNQVSVYYDVKDDKYQNPLLVCLGQQTVGQTTDTTVTNTQCKKWHKRNSIDITDWVAESEGDDASAKYSSPESIQKELQSIIGLFKDYLYLDIGSTSPYQANVKHQTGPKQKVERTGDSGADTTKIKVAQVNGDGAGEGGGADQVQVPGEYKGYKHELAAFYNGAKAAIQKLLKSDGVTSNEIPEDSDPELHLRFQVGGRDLTLFANGGENPLANPLKYGKEQASESGESGTTPSKYDPVVYFYGKGGIQGAGSSKPDTVPLLFRFGTQYFGPKDRHSYFHGWCKYTINAGDGGQTTSLKKKLDSINRQLNEIDLTQTGGTSSRATDYGLDKGGVTSLGVFQTKRITVKRDDNPVMGSGTTMSTYTTVTHTTTNGYDIGDIRAIGPGCTFDNKHTQKLARESNKHNQAVAVYATSDTSTLQNPSLVLIAESTGSGLGTSSTSTVLGYYDLSGGCPTGKQYTFKTVTGGFTLSELTDKETVQGSCPGLVAILERIGIVKTVQAPVLTQAASSDSGLGQDGQEEGQEDPNTVSQEDSGQDDNSLGVGGDGLNHSGGMGAGAKAPQGQSGPVGPAGARGKNGDRGDSREHTEATASSSGHTTTPNNHGDLSQEQHTIGGGGVRREGGEQGLPGEKAEPGAQTDSGGGGSDIMETIKQPYVYGSASAVGGVGVIGGVGVVVYKK